MPQVYACAMCLSSLVLGERSPLQRCLPETRNNIASLPLVKHELRVFSIVRFVPCLDMQPRNGSVIAPHSYVLVLTSSPVFVRTLYSGLCAIYLSIPFHQSAIRMDGGSFFFFGLRRVKAIPPERVAVSIRSCRPTILRHVSQKVESLTCLCSGAEFPSWHV
jgi:hypothetical protein